MDENAMRGFVARLGMLLEVIVIGVNFHFIVLAMTIYSAHLALSVRTPAAYCFTAYFVAGALGMTAKGDHLLHRKWREYQEAETDSQNEYWQGPWRNPSIEVKNESRTAVGIANGIALAAVLLPLLLYSYYQIYHTVTLGTGLVVISTSLALVAASIWSYLSAVK